MWKALQFVDYKSPTRHCWKEEDLMFNMIYHKMGSVIKDYKSFLLDKFPFFAAVICTINKSATHGSRAHVN